MWQLVETRARQVNWLLELSALVFCVLLVGATAIGSGLNHNEQMYIAAARLWPQYSLYSDYAYLQAPLLPMVNGGLFAVTGNEHLLLLARLHAAFWALVALCAVYALGRKLSGSRVVGVAAAAVLASHQLFVSNVAESSNYIMPLGLTLVSFWTLVVAADAQSSARLRSVCAGLSGLAIGLAVSCKSFYALLGIGMFAIAVATKNRRLALQWVAGGALGVLPLVFYAIQEPSGFYFGNLDYHLSNTEYRREEGSRMAMSLTQKLRFLRRIWSQPFLIGLSAYCVAACFLLRRFDASPEARRRVFVTWGLVLLACTAALLPTPAYLQYFAMPYACLLVTALAAAGLYATWWRGILVALCVVGVVSAPATRGLGKSLRRSSAPARVEREAKQLGEHLDCSAETYVATLSPILALEAGCSIYPELATGPFAFRVADHRAHDVQEDLAVVGPSRLLSFLELRKPQAILVGFEPRHDYVFENYAKQQGYVEVQQRFMKRGRLWLAPRVR